MRDMIHRDEQGYALGHHEIQSISVDECCDQIQQFMAEASTFNQQQTDNLATGYDHWGQKK